MEVLASRVCRAASLPPSGSSVLLSPLDVIHVSQMPILIFYDGAPPGAEARVERGLAAVLDHYPELAGRIGRDELARHCIHLSNDGALFVTAASGERMTEFLAKRGNNLEELVGSATLELGDAANRIPLIVQATRFACDGLAISWEGHHRVCDGTAHAQFLLEWASCARNGSPTASFSPLLHDRSVLLPRAPPAVSDPHSRHVYQRMRSAPLEGGSAHDELTTVCVDFSARHVADLKALCGNRFTTYETLAAHLWRSMTAARGLDRSSTVGLFCPANGRAILKTPPGFFGNATFHCLAQASAQEILDLPLPDAAHLVRDAIKRCSNADFIASVSDFLAIQQAEQDAAAAAAPAPPPPPNLKAATWEPNVMVASWSRFPFYEVDFGFGDPVRFSTANVGTEGVFTIGPVRKDGVMEVFVNVRKSQVASLLDFLGK